MPHIDQEKYPDLKSEERKNWASNLLVLPLFVRLVVAILPGLVALASCPCITLLGVCASSFARDLIQLLSSTETLDHSSSLDSSILFVPSIDCTGRQPP
jgi:hypothetical protein